MKISELVAKYVELRDKKAEFKNEYDAKVAKLDEVLESTLLKTFETTGMDSVKTEFGTAYTTERSTASVADKDAFMSFVKSREDWHLMEVRASKTAIQQYKDEHQDLPPGINWRSERVVNIRRT
jgi:hypothetical protein